MKDFEYYLIKAEEEPNKKSPTSEERRIRKLERIAKALMLFFCLVILFCCIYGIVNYNYHEDSEIDEVIIEDDSLPGDQTVASGYASVELLKAEGIYEEPTVVYTHSATFKVTHYCGCTKCCGKWSTGSESDAVGARGTHLQPFYSVAVDTSIIPLGTVLYDADGTQYVAEDTGSSVKGYHVDLFTGNHKEAKELGVKEIELYW